MLKIKDSVDLKELEKFGFKILMQEDEINEDNYYDTYATKKLGNHYILRVETDIEFRQLTLIQHSDLPFVLAVTWQLDIIYDLIKADLVEKVEV